MESDSHRVLGYWAGLGGCSIIGYTLLLGAGGKVAENLSKRVRDRMFRKLLSLEPGYHDINKIGESTTQVRRRGRSVRSAADSNASFTCRFALAACRGYDHAEGLLPHAHHEPLAVIGQHPSRIGPRPRLHVAHRPNLPRLHPPYGVRDQDRDGDDARLGYGQGRERREGGAQGWQRPVREPHQHPRRVRSRDPGEAAHGLHEGEQG